MSDESGDSWLDALAALPASIRGKLRERPVPSTIEPMLATSSDRRFSDPAWLFEPKLDGVRCLATCDAGQIRLQSRTAKDMTLTYPEIVVALADHAPETAVLDGEIVAFEGTHTSFGRLQGRLGLNDPNRALATGIEVFYYVFDILQIGAIDVQALPLTFRKQLLAAAVSWQDPLRLTSHVVGAGEEAYAAAAERGDEGVLAKRADSRYVSGRSSDWLKWKCVREQEFVVCGWTDPGGSRVGIGALLVGYYDDGRLVYAGKVGTGFTSQVLTRLRRQLESLAADGSPFDVGQPERGAHFVRPELVAQVGFGEWTHEGILRHPRFLGLRDDKPAADVVRET